MTNHAIRRALIAAIPCAFAAHVLEESPGFVTWFNAHVARGITTDLFWTVTVFALVITLLVCALMWLAPSELSDLLVFSWLSFLFAANAVLHIVGALVDGAYVPGLVTAMVLYVPVYIALTLMVVQARRLPTAALVASGILSATPMLVHGYLIIFRGDRLF